MKRPLTEILWVAGMLAASSATTLMPLFGDQGPQANDVRAVITSSGWFEVLTTGVLMTSPNLLTANITNINDTHAAVSLWKPIASSTTGLPEAVAVDIAKRPWSSESPYTWPATLYDAFHTLYASSLEQTTMTNGNAATFNARQIFYAIYGGAVMEQCGANITNELLLVQHNTETGPIVEVITRNDIVNDRIQHVYQTSGRVETADSRRSSWWPDCIMLFWRGDRETGA